MSSSQPSAVKAWALPHAARAADVIASKCLCMRAFHAAASSADRVLGATSSRWANTSSISEYRTITAGARPTCGCLLATAMSCSLSPGSRTTTKRQGCRFHADGARPASRRISRRSCSGIASLVYLRIERRCSAESDALEGTLPVQDCARVHEATAKAVHQDGLSRLETSVPQTRGECQRNRGRRCVAVPLDARQRPLGRDAGALADGLDDPGIGAMGHKPVERLGRKTGLIEEPADARDDGLDGPAVDFAAVLVDEARPASVAQA